MPHRPPPATSRHGTAASRASRTTSRARPTWRRRRSRTRPRPRPRRARRCPAGRYPPPTLPLQYGLNLPASTSTCVLKIQPATPSAGLQANSSALRDAMNQGKLIKQYEKEGRPLSELPQTESKADPSLVPCPHCGRSFNATAAERHIPKCTSIKAQPTRLRAGGRAGGWVGGRAGGGGGRWVGRGCGGPVGAAAVRRRCGSSACGGRVIPERWAWWRCSRRRKCSRQAQRRRLRSCGASAAC
jgi:hypothetical protein